ncbi:unnamed protein product, partial [Brenthis ino]
MLNEAQFHGAKRLTDSHFRFYWTLSLAMLFIAAVTVVYETIQRFFSDPTFIAKNESIDTSIQFPTVLICPEVSYPGHKIDKFISKINFPPSLNVSYIKGVLQQFSAFVSPDVVFNQEDLEKVQELLDFNNLDIHHAGLLLTPSCEETLLREMRENTIHVQNKGVYVDRLGFNNGLTIAVNQKEVDLANIDLLYKWVAIATGQHYVDITVNGTPISPGEEFWVGYSTLVMQVSDDAVSLSADQRKCRMAHEPLQYFPLYHKYYFILSSKLKRYKTALKSYCLLECEMRRTMKQCQCLKVVHPNIRGVPLCRANRLDCAKRASVSFAMNECNCPPTCNVEKDDSLLSTYQLMANSHTYDRFYEDLDLEQVSTVRVFVEKRNKKILQRRSYFNCFNLFSQLGGVFNVFFGCSILTMLELLLLASRAMRFCINKYRNI